MENNHLNMNPNPNANANVYTTCVSKTCCKKTWMMATIAAFVVMMAFDWLYHGQLLRSMYEQFANLWRSDADMMTLWPWCVGAHLLMAGTFACLAACVCAVCDGVCPCKKGMKLGLKVGLLMGLGAFATYVMLPISMELALAWLFGNVVKFTITGFVVGMIYKKQMMVK